VLQLKFELQGVGAITPSQVSSFQLTSGSSAGDLFMPSKPYVPKFSPLGIHGLGS